MATTSTFGNMLQEFVPVELLKEEFLKRSWLLQNVNVNESWKASNLVIPFQGQSASTIEFGQLAADTDISKFKFVRGGISTQPEVWGSLSFAHKDLLQHNGKIPESTFLRIVPDQIDSFLTLFKETISTHLLSPNLATVNVDGNASGVLGVDRVDRFTIDQKVVLTDGNTAAATYYVTNVNVYSSTITLSASRGGAAADVSTYTVSQAATVTHPGAAASGMTNLASQLLSPANGGSSNLFGQSKLAYSYLQAVQIDGTGVSATNLLAKIFAGYTKRQQLCKGGGATKVLMSFKHFGTAMSQIETQKGQYNVVPGSRKANQYGWQEIQIGSVTGDMLSLVAVAEKDDATIMFLDTDSLTFYCNGGVVVRRRAPDGKEYFEQRTQQGYVYILDHSSMGDLVCEAPWKNAIMYGIPNY